MVCAGWGNGKAVLEEGTTHRRLGVGMVHIGKMLWQNEEKECKMGVRAQNGELKEPTNEPQGEERVQKKR